MRQVRNTELVKLKKYFDEKNIPYEIRIWENGEYNIHIKTEWTTLSFLTSFYSYGGDRGLIEFYDFKNEPTSCLTANEAILIYEKEAMEI